MTLAYRKNYRKPLLQRYVIRILLMYAQPLLDLDNQLIRLQGPYILGILMGEYHVVDRSFLSRPNT